MTVRIALRSALFALSDALDLVGVNDFQHGKRVAMIARETAALVGLTAGVAACTEKPNAATPAAPAGAAPAASHATTGANVHLKPGELDTYYGLWSGGHTGDMRVLGMPSGREILRIPCFVPDALVGWGITNESKAVMGTKPDGSLRYTVGDTHHTHASYKDGDYDGRYAWINDKINSRLARKHGLTCWSNTESFDRDVHIKFPPIAWPKLRHKIEAARTAGVDKLITFEFSHFLSPNSIFPSAKGLHRLYMEWKRAQEAKRG